MLVSPPNVVSSIDVTVHGISFHVPNLEWDDGKGRYFAKDTSPYKVPYGSNVSAIANLRNGNKVIAQFTYKKGCGTSDGSSS